MDARIKYSSRDESDSTKSKFSLYIIESLGFDDEVARCEGKILRDILVLSGHSVDYIYIRTKKELDAALHRFQASNRRYLHISCHGNKHRIELTLDSIKFKEFGAMVRPYLSSRRLFVSACQVVNSDLAAAMLPNSGCYSLIGPNFDINMDDAVLMWSSFYHLMFRDPEVDIMKRGKIRWALRRIREAFAGEGIRSEFRYAKPTSKTLQGFRWVAIDEPETDPSEVD